MGSAFPPDENACLVGTHLLVLLGAAGRGFSTDGLLDDAVVTPSIGMGSRAVGQVERDEVLRRLISLGSQFAVAIGRLVVGTSIQESEE